MESKLTLTQSTDNYSIATVGDLTSFQGKAFIKDLMGTTSMEVSLGTLNPGEGVPFFHAHKQNEEVYIFIKGNGTITLDGQKTPVASGTIVRVAPQVSRTISCEGTETMLYICAQAKASSLEQSVATDAIIEQ